jgi:hypothetical protein
MPRPPPSSAPLPTTTMLLDVPPLLAAPPAARALTLTKYGAAPVIGPSWIPGS